MTSKITVWFIIALSLIGFFTLLFMTKSGIGTSPDSVTYIGVARNLLEGKGVSVPFGRVIDSPLTQHPPLYPIVLALIGFLGIDPLTGARWLNIFLFGTLILFVGLSIKYHTSNSIWMPVFGSFLVLTSAVTLGIHSFAWTEPLFILLVFGGLALLAAYLDNSKWVFLVSASFLIGMATLTRYVGVAVIAAGFLGIMLLQDGKFLKKFRDAIYFGLISFLPIIIWLMRNSLSTNSVTSRDIIFHPITVSQLLQALHTISTWLLIPVATPGLIKVLIWLIIFVGILLISYFQRKNLKSQKVNQPNKEVQKIHPYIQLLGILILTYGAFLLFSISFLDANTPLDDRILSPIFIALLVLFTYFAYRLLSLTSNTLSIKISMILVACFFSISYLLIGTNLFIENYNQGLGFSRLEWQHSELVEQIKKLPNETIIHSNAPYAVYILSGRPALSLPKKFESMNQQINKDFESEMEIISSEITLNNSMVVFFDLFSRNPLEEKAELESNFRILNQTSDGTIFTPNPEE